MERSGRFDLSGSVCSLGIWRCGKRIAKSSVSCNLAVGVPFCSASELIEYLASDFDPERRNNTNARHGFLLYVALTNVRVTGGPTIK